MDEKVRKLVAAARTERAANLAHAHSELARRRAETKIRQLELRRERYLSGDLGRGLMDLGFPCACAHCVASIMLLDLSLACPKGRYEP